MAGSGDFYDAANDATYKRRGSDLIEIGEEAYKQNTVYCTWQDILSGHIPKEPDSQSSEQG